VYADDVQAMEEILPEPPILDRALKVSVCSRQNSDIYA
jgi:hypothetical protein